MNISSPDDTRQTPDDPSKTILRDFWNLIDRLLSEDPVKISDDQIKTITTRATYIPILDYGFTQKQIDSLIKLNEKILTYYQSEEVKKKVQPEKIKTIVDLVDATKQEIHFILGDVLLHRQEYSKALEQYLIGKGISKEAFGASTHFIPKEKAFSKQLNEFVSFLLENKYPADIIRRVKNSITDSIGKVEFLAFNPDTKQREGYVLTLKVDAQPVATELDGVSEDTGLVGKITNDISAQADMALEAISMCLIKQHYEFGLKAQGTYRIDFPDFLSPLGGKSIGLAFLIAIVSAVTKIPVRQSIAFTGEVHSNRIREVAGIEEKTRAAEADMRIKWSFFPSINRAEAMPYSKTLEVIGVESVEGTISMVFSNENPWQELKNQLAAARKLHYGSSIEPIRRNISDFVERPELFSRLSRVVSEYDIGFLDAEPGFGKSIAAQVFADDNDYVFHSLDRQIPSTIDPERVAQSIYYRSIFRYGLTDECSDFRDSKEVLTHLCERLDKLHAKIGGKAVIVIDALDEGLENSIHKIFPGRAFDNVVFLFTSRPATQIEGMQDRQRALIIKAKDIPDEELRIDMERYLTSMLSPDVKDRLEESDYGLLFEKSNDNFLYLYYFCQKANADPESLRNIINALPPGLEGWFRIQLTDMRAEMGIEEFHNYLVPVIEMLAVIREPMSEKYIADVLSYPTVEVYAQIYDAIGRLHGYCRLEHRQHVTYLSLDTSGFTDFIKECEYFDLSKAHGKIAEYYRYGERLIDRVSKVNHSEADYSTIYGFKYLPHHLAEARQHEKLIALLDMDFLPAKCDFLKSRSAILADYDLMERACAKRKDYDNLLRLFLEEVRHNEIALKEASIPSIATMAAQGRWVEALDVVSFIAEDGQRAQALASLASVSAMAGHKERAERLIHQVDKIVEQSKGLDYIKLAKCIALADYKRSFKYIVALPHVNEKRRWLTMMVGEHDVARAFTQVILILHEYDPEICKDAILYISKLFSEGDEYISGLNYPDYGLPSWFVYIYTYLLPEYIEKRDFDLLRVLSRDPKLFIGYDFFDALYKGSKQLSLDDQIVFLNMLFGYIGEAVIEPGSVDLASPLFERLYDVCEAD